MGIPSRPGFKKKKNTNHLTFIRNYASLTVIHLLEKKEEANRMNVATFICLNRYQSLIGAQFNKMQMF